MGPVCRRLGAHPQDKRCPFTGVQVPESGKKGPDSQVIENQFKTDPNLVRFLRCRHS
jgi:hypothetical protein